MNDKDVKIAQLEAKVKLLQEQLRHTKIECGTHPTRDVRAFFEKFGVPIAEKPHWPAEDVIDFRFNHLREELEEFALARRERNLADLADSLIDLAYLSIGTCLTFGIPFLSVWNEVHKANMAKVRAAPDGSNSKRGHGTDVIKPEGWRPPNVARIIEEISA